VARQRYRQFVKDGVAQGKRPELQGGSQSGVQTAEYEKSDSRILGSGEFACPAK